MKDIKPGFGVNCANKPEAREIDNVFHHLGDGGSVISPGVYTDEHGK